MQVSINTLLSTQANTQTITGQAPVGNLSLPVPLNDDFILPVLDKEIVATKIDYDPEQSLKVFEAPLKIGKDTQDIAQALRRTMRTVLEDRPDLSSARFDFVTENGAIKVLSEELNDKDRSWLERELNKNTDLTTALAGFHDRYTTLYANAAGKKLSAQTISERVDKSVQFMSLLHELGSDIQRTLIRSNGKFQRIDGGPLDLSKAPDSAAAFLGFMEQIDKVQEGSISFTMNTGKVHYQALRMSNPFIATGFKIVKDIYSEVKAEVKAEAKPNSLGLHERA